MPRGGASVIMVVRDHGRQQDRRAEDSGRRGTKVIPSRFIPEPLAREPLTIPAQQEYTA
jgi:hypothetical protein